MHLPRHPSSHPGASGAIAALALLVTLGACTSPSPSPSPTATAVRTPAPSSAAPEVSVAATAGDVALRVTMPGASIDAPGIQVSSDAGAGTTTLTVDPAALDDQAPGFVAPPEIALTSAGTFETHPDGSVSVRGGDAPVGGLDAPHGARLVAVDDTRLELRAAGDAAAEDAVITLGTSAVAGTDWGEREGGRSLAVTPTDWTRAAGRAGIDLAWSELVAADPEVDTPTMHDQLECHAIGAPDKATWNLEPWRPDVGMLAVMAARCNPTS